MLSSSFDVPDCAGLQHDIRTPNSSFLSIRPNWDGIIFIATPLHRLRSRNRQQKIKINKKKRKKQTKERELEEWVAAAA